MNTDLEIVFKFIIEQEGTGYSDLPDDPGGPTRYGVTLDTWRAFNHNWKLTSNDVKNITFNQAQAVFQKYYWEAPSLLPAGIDLAVADMAWNDGSKTSIILLQQALGFSDYNVDGVLGPVTLGAAGNMNIEYLISEFGKECVKHYTNGSSPYKASLLKRNEKRITAALNLAKANS